MKSCMFSSSWLAAVPTTERSEFAVVTPENLTVVLGLQDQYLAHHCVSTCLATVGLTWEVDNPGGLGVLASVRTARGGAVALLPQLKHNAVSICIPYAMKWVCSCHRC